MNRSVHCSREPISIPTYGLGDPEKNPLFFEKRVYQGSSGKVYPVPFIDKVHDSLEEKSYDSVQLENEWVRLVMLPEIGGRIFRGQDKANQDYDFFYRQDVIKPALVGLAGPWISGGVEFNWPQHHRPGTYMPADVHIEEEADGGCTVWLSEHDPLNRLKGMHGIRLRPDSALIELRARLFNRTPLTHTFLWWANVAARVHDQYQSFFPSDVHYVADHAVRAQSSYPIANNLYYGVDYGARPGANDLSWYKNIEVPTSYMVCDTKFNFFGGYDHKAASGFIHVANRHIAPGKKQWTWGNHDFGWAWDRELTDENGPYVELMAGVYTDNQPDFSYLAPYETKTFSQYWWPYQGIGPVQNANQSAALRLVVRDDKRLDLGVAVSRVFHGARIVLKDGERLLVDERVDLSPDTPWKLDTLVFRSDNPESLELSLEGELSYRPVNRASLARNRDVATEPPLPGDVQQQEELVLIAEHLEQYRHPTRYPEMYWDEALRRDPMDARAHLAYGRRKLGRGLFEAAEAHLTSAVKRLTMYHPNPVTGEAHYYLGVVCRFQGRSEEAYEAFYKATWDYAWRAPAYYELAMLDSQKGDNEQALEHCRASLETNGQNNKARILIALVQQRLQQNGQGELIRLLDEDPLDHWARHASGDFDGFLDKSRNDAQTILDVVYDYADAGFRAEAIALLKLHHASPVAPVAVPNPLERSPLTYYALAWLTREKADLQQARSLSPDYFFPSRLHDQIVLTWALAQDGDDLNAAYGLGNYLYDRKRYEEAIACWQQARDADTEFATVHRNLGIAYWNIHRDGEAARAAYQEACRLDPKDARLLAEYDQLREKLGDPAEDRLQALIGHPDLVDERDDCSVALATLCNDTNQAEAALNLLQRRTFHPWEGGEGKVLRQYSTACLLLGQQALGNEDGETALAYFLKAMEPPENLGEAYHLLQARADVNYWKGRALRLLGREEEAASCFEASAAEGGDFKDMAVTEHSELSYYRGLSLVELGRQDQARRLFEELKTFAQGELEKAATVDYFATSLPQLLVFVEDMQMNHQRHMESLVALAEKGIQQL